jgi:hypothetical protein
MTQAQPQAVSDTLRLNLGSGDRHLDGYVNLDHKGGDEVYPLHSGTGSVDEVRASHILEHFSHTQIGRVLDEWVRVLKPGGVLKVAVPDFELIARAYLAGKQIPIQGYVMGGHVDADDHHGALFDREALTDALSAAGLVGISDWTSEAKDCAALAVSLNLQGYKPPAEWPRTAAVMSTPRLGFNDMWGKTLEALSALRIPLVKHTGAFWEQCITRALTEALKKSPEYILSLDYDSVFDLHDVQSLLSAASRHPEADAIAALQVHRRKATPLMTVASAEGKNAGTIPFDAFGGELIQARTAHFGLTLIKAEKLSTLPRPWLHGQPEADGEWGEGRTDPDVAFWKNWERAGNTLYVANRVPVGHLEVMIRWPGRDLAAIYQHPSDYHDAGRPEAVWR